MKFHFECDLLEQKNCGKLSFLAIMATTHLWLTCFLPPSSFPCEIVLRYKYFNTYLSGNGRFLMLKSVIFSIILSVIKKIKTLCRLLRGMSDWRLRDFVFVYHINDKFPIKIVYVLLFWCIINQKHIFMRLKFFKKYRKTAII